jgi:hypothetical protein
MRGISEMSKRRFFIFLMDELTLFLQIRYDHAKY